MSTLETNSIAKYSGNNVSIDDSLNLKSYTTTQRDALTSVAGDTIYNTTTSKIEFYTGSAWVEGGGADISTFTVEFLVLGPGGGGGGGESHTAGDQGGGGGAGRYRTSYGSGNIYGGLSAVESDLTINKGVPIPVSIGAGGTGGGDTANGGTGNYNGHQGGDSVFSTLTAWGGGYGGGNGTGGQGGNGTVGSGGGGGASQASKSSKLNSSNVTSSATSSLSDSTGTEGLAGGGGLSNCSV